MRCDVDDRIHREYVTSLIEGKHDSVNQGADAAKPAAEGQNGAAPATPVDPNALPADQQPVPAHELRERLNLFDDAAPKPAAPGAAAPAPTAPPAAAPAPAPKQ